MEETKYIKVEPPLTQNTSMPTEMHFEKASWWKRWKGNNKLLREENTRLVQEHMEWLQKMRDLHLEKEMVKELAVRQAKEIKELYDKNYEAERKAKMAIDELKTLKEGIPATGHEVKTIGLVKTGKEYAPLVITLDQEAKKILKREVLTPTGRKTAIESAKIAFVESFDPVPEEELM